LWCSSGCPITCEAGVSVKPGARAPGKTLGRRCEAREAGGSVNPGREPQGRPSKNFEPSRFEAAHGNIMRFLDRLSCHPQGLRPAIHAVARFAGHELLCSLTWGLRPGLTLSPASQALSDFQTSTFLTCTLSIFDFGAKSNGAAFLGDAAPNMITASDQIKGSLLRSGSPHLLTDAL
jgi:hypothetical protein